MIRARRAASPPRRGRRRQTLNSSEAFWRAKLAALARYLDQRHRP